MDTRKGEYISMRKFVIVFMIGIFQFLCVTAYGGVLQNDGKISIYNYHENEYAEITYKKNGKYLPEGKKKIEHILRSHGDEAEHTISPQLIELLDHLQDHFGAETIEIISGYRSPNYNQNLMDEGRKVASESLHMQGLGADIHIDEIKEADIFEYVKKLSLGGVGIYPKNLFVHVDKGPVRTWAGESPKNRVIIGTENNQNLAWSIITDKNEYQKGEVVKATITNNDYNRQRYDENVWIQRFTKGEWGEETGLTKGKAYSLKPRESNVYEWNVPEDAKYGKYRFVIFVNRDLGQPPAYSNEFYFKKK